VSKSIRTTNSKNPEAGNLTAEQVFDVLPLTGSFERCYVPEVALLAGVANWHTQQTQNGNFVASARFETLHNRLIPQKKMATTRSSRLLDFWVIFEAF
jgi:hypothetical protein